MTDTLGKIKNFVNYVRHTLKGDEKGEDQLFYEALFKAFGHKGCREAGAQTQFRVKSPGQHTKFADLVWRPRLLLEMKSRGEKLEKHHQQVFEYWDKLIPQPRYVVLCNFDEFWIYDTTLQIEEPVNRVKLEELPKQYNALDFLFPGNAGVEPHGRGTAMPCPYENIPPSGAVQVFGREQELERLHQLLTPPASSLKLRLIKGGEQQNKLTIAAIVGMGGVGKTELAMRYAWQHLQGLGDGAGGVCWVDGRDGDIGIQLVNFARSLLNLNPPEDWDLPTQLKYCWRNWQSGEWLIVIDDVTNYRQQVKPYLPPESSQFNVLLTTREEFGRPVEHLSLDKLQPEAALDLLTSLVGVQRIQQESDIAEQLCQWLDYLPLGLELVGRYLERDPDLSLKAMLSLLEKKRLRHRSVLEADSTMTAKLGVADAFELSWERLDENAQFLGCLLSLFASADIPWDLVKLAYSNMPSSENEEIDLNILEEARADLVRFNLLQRTGEGTYRLHQLIREFLWEKREQSPQVSGLKQGFVAAMVAVAEQIPNSPTRQQIQAVAPAMPHVVQVAIHQDMMDLLRDEDLVSPFVGLGMFYEGRGLYEQAQPWFEQCLSVTQSRFGSNHTYVAMSLNQLANLYYLQGCYNDAEPLLVQALEINKRLLGENHSNVTTSLNSLGILYQSQGRYTEAESQLVQALELDKRLRTEDPLHMIPTLNNLAGLYCEQGRYSEAEPLFVQARELCKNLLEEDHPHVPASLNGLAYVYTNQGRYRKAESLYLQAIELCKKLLGEEHPNMAQILNNLANLYCEQDRFSKAEPLFIKSLEIRKCLLGEEHPDVATSLHNLANLYSSKGRYGEAESLYLQALELDKSLLGKEHPDVATSLNSLATLYSSQGRYSEAESLYLQALELDKRLLEEDHPALAKILKNLASLYIRQDKHSKAEPLLVQALEIFQRRLGPTHPQSVDCREGLVKLRAHLNSTARELPNFNQKTKKGNSKKKPKGFG
jgi:tetratricopeptide (TPR) repeat protein